MLQDPACDEPHLAQLLALRKFLERKPLVALRTGVQRHVGAVVEPGVLEGRVDGTVAPFNVFGPHQKALRPTVLSNLRPNLEDASTAVRMRQEQPINVVRGHALTRVKVSRSETLR